MAKIKQTLEEQVAKIFTDVWTDPVKGRVVPDTDSLTFKNESVELDAVILYADLADSTELVENNIYYIAGEVYKTYLYCAARIITNNGGTVVSYDGDRIMAVFLGDYKNTNAVKAALMINGAVIEIIRPKFAECYPSVDFEINHGIGIDSGTIHVAKTGARGTNDLVWIGRAANHAAKLSDIREDGYPIVITKEVYDRTNVSEKKDGDGDDMWEARTWEQYDREVYVSGYRRVDI